MVEDGRALDGAVDTVVRARHHGLVNHFVTNTARRHHHDLLQELSELGFAPQSGELATAPLAALSWLKREHHRPLALASCGCSHWGWSRSSG
jgi:ribonucleotide monophosphatase NagD (HAD superfamily)